MAEVDLRAVVFTLVDQVGQPHGGAVGVADDAGQFGDVGTVFETCTLLGHLAAVTEHVVLGAAAVVLPLRRASTSCVRPGLPGRPA